MLAQFEISDLFEMLFEPEMPSNYSIDDLTSIVTRKRRNRRRYETPKVFKNDIRWSYSNMFVNVLSSSDVYFVNEFLQTYAVSDMQHSNALKDGDTPWYENVGIASFLKHWFLNTCVAPDIVYGISNPNVKNLADGSSEISFILTVTGNFIYEKPSLEDDVDGLNVTNEETVGSKRKIVITTDASKWKSRTTKSNIKRVSNYQSQDRVRVGEYCPVKKGYMCDTLLEELDSIVLTSFRAHPVSVVSNGHFTMKLDSNKRIVSTFFEQIDDNIKPINLSDV